MRRGETTRTLAALYLGQGYGAEARDAYEALLGRFPDDEDLKRGLGEAQALVSAMKKNGLGVLLGEWVALARQCEKGGRNEAGRP